MVRIFCDEAGNSGANLLDPEQPFFVLASNDFYREEAESLLQHVRSAQGAEPKFTALRKSGAGVAKLIQFLADPRMSKDRILINVFDKRFMVTTKMVDLVAETLIHEIGGDLYAQGANIAFSNMLHYCMPAFCGQENTDRFLSAFVELIRRRSNSQVDAFYDAGRVMLESSSNIDFKRDLFMFTERNLFEQWFGEHINSLALDPAVPALFAHIATWSVRKSERFHVVHDDSKPVLASQDTFDSMLALTGEESSLIGYDRRKMLFPLRAESLTQSRSTDHPQLQIADLCAGAFNHYSRCMITGAFDELATALRDLNCIEWVTDGVIPSPDVTPASLGTEERGGTNAIDEISSYLRWRDSFARNSHSPRTTLS